MSDEFQIGNPARYQDICAALTEDLEADCVMLVVVANGRREGFCVSARQGQVPDLHTDPGVARYLRMLAERVEKRGGLGFHLRPVKKKGQQN